MIARVCRRDYAQPGKPDIDWDDPAARQQLVSDLVNDALAVLAELTGPDAPQRDDAAADALGLLALVAGQDVEPAEDSDGTDGRWRIARKVAPDRVISTVDPQARHTRKSKSKRRDGFRGHVAAEPETGLITDCEMTMAAGDGSSDAENGVKMAARDRFHGPRSRAAAGTGAGADSADGADGSQAGTAGAGARRRRRPAAARGSRGPASPPVPPAAAMRRAPGTRTTRRPQAVRGWRCTATRPTAAARPGPPTGTPGRHRDQAQAAAARRARRVSLDDFTINEDERTVACRPDMSGR